VLNAEPWLDELLLSLRAQTYPRWRAVVVDDGSSDGSRALAERHAAEDERIAVSETPGSGPGARLARIHGRSLLPDADLLYFPDADDVVLPELLERLAGRLAERPDAAAVFCRHLELLPDGTRRVPAFTRWWVPTRFWLRPLEPDREDPPIAMLIGGAADFEAVLMVDAAAYDRVGGLDAAPAMGSHTFRDLVLRLALLRPVLAVDEALYLYRRHDAQVSRNLAMLQANQARLDTHWRDLERRGALPADEIERATYLARHRLQPALSLENARRQAAHGRVGRALMSLAAAAVRYRPFRPG
jgi:glycosyltransferase involved in cell wall biosynthesis